MGPRAAGYPSGAILRWGMDTFASDPEPLWRKAEELLGPDSKSIFMFQLDLMAVLGGKNPAAAMDFLKGIRGSRGEELLSTLCAAWGRNEPREALLALVSFGSPSDSLLTERSWRFNVGSMGFEDLAWARKEGVPDEFLAKIRNASYYREVREGHLEQLLDRAAAESGTEDRGSRNTHPLALAVASQRPEDFVANMKRLEEVGAFVAERDATTVGNLLMEWRSDAAREFFDALADCPAAQIKLADSISRYHMRNDANRTAAWAASLPSGPIRDAALAPLLDYLRRHNETESLRQWSALLSGAPEAAGNDSR